MDGKGVFCLESQGAGHSNSIEKKRYRWSFENDVSHSLAIALGMPVIVVTKNGRR